MTVATVTKKIGSGQVYTDLATWETGKPANLVTSEKWSAGTFTGTFQQGETVTGTGLTAGKFLDSDGSSYVTFGITTGNSNTLVTLTGSTSLATCVVSTKTDTGIIWQGQINATGDAFSASSPLDVTGSTSSSACYTELTAATGASFVDNANAQTNALRANSANGCIVTGTANYGQVINYDENFKCSRLQLAGTGARTIALASNGGTGVLLDCNQVIAEGKGQGDNNDGIITVRGGGKVRNTLMVNRNATAAGIILRLNGSNAYNCTAVVPSDLTKATTGISAVGTCVAQNCAVFGATADTNGGLTTSTTNYTDDTTPSTGFTGSIAFSTATFKVVVDATRDFKLVAGSGLLDVGTTDSTNAATDIVGTSRPQGSAPNINYDVGCWELVVAAGGTVYHRLPLLGVG